MTDDSSYEVRTYEVMTYDAMTYYIMPNDIMAINVVTYEVMMRGTIGVETQHNIERKSLFLKHRSGCVQVLHQQILLYFAPPPVSALSVGGWSKIENNATLWLHLASWNLPDSQPS